MPKCPKHPKFRVPQRPKSSCVTECLKCPSAFWVSFALQVPNCPAAFWEPKYPGVHHIFWMLSVTDSLCVAECLIRYDSNKIVSIKDVLCIWQKTKMAGKIFRKLILKQNQSVDLKSFWDLISFKIEFCFFLWAP